MELRCSCGRWSQWDRISKLRCIRGRPFVRDGDAHWCHDYQRDPGAADDRQEFAATAKTVAEFPILLWLTWNLCADSKRHVLWVLAGLNPGFHLYTKPWSYFSLDERCAIRAAIEKVLEADRIAPQLKEESSGRDGKPIEEKKRGVYHAEPA